MNIMQLFEVLFITVFISYLITPLIRQIAFKTGYLDNPSSTKVHAHPIPLLGGIVVYSAFFIAAITTSLKHIPQIYYIFIGCTILLVIGLVDDKFGMMPNIKLLGQFLAALIVIKAGIRTSFMKSYYVDVIVSYIWIIGITNAFNLLDNMNGLSSGIAVISSLSFGIMCLLDGQINMAGLSFALAGSCLGFLRHNFPKAKIFLGDSGSLLIGYILAILSIKSSWQIYSINSSLFVPLVVLSYPIFDTSFVTIMRLMEGRTIFQGGRDHSSHRLALTGLKKFRAVLVIYFICAVMGLLGIIVTKSNIYSGVIIGILVLMFFLIFGIRLSFVRTYQHGHRKKNNAE